MSKPQNTITCWIIDADEYAQITGANPFNPSYSPYLYFQITERRDHIIEGNLGHSERTETCFCWWDSTSDYLNNYREKRKQYVTFDKVHFYEIIEIIPVEPFLFILQKPGGAVITHTAGRSLS